MRRTDLRAPLTDRRHHRLQVLLVELQLLTAVQQPHHRPVLIQHLQHAALLLVELGAQVLGDHLHHDTLPEEERDTVIAWSNWGEKVISLTNRKGLFQC